jgi:hypothetical protein
VSAPEPHGWTINITCPRCRHRGDVVTSFPCCEHVAALEARVAELERALEASESVAAKHGDSVLALRGRVAELEEALRGMLQLFPLTDAARRLRERFLGGPGERDLAIERARAALSGKAGT